MKKVDLLSCAPATLHANHHEPDPAHVIAMVMKTEMIDLVQTDPIPPVGRKREAIILKYKALYHDSDRGLWK